MSTLPQLGQLVKERSFLWFEVGSFRWRPRGRRRRRVPDYLYLYWRVIWDYDGESKGMTGVVRVGRTKARSSWRPTRIWWISSQPRPGAMARPERQARSASASMGATSERGSAIAMRGRCASLRPSPGVVSCSCARRPVVVAAATGGRTDSVVRRVSPRVGVDKPTLPSVR